MGNVINSCPNNKILLSSIKLNDPSKSCLNCSKIGYQLNSTSTACICSTGFYSNNNICYPISCSATGYIPNPNDNTMLQLIPLPYNNDFDGFSTTKNKDIGYNINFTYGNGNVWNIFNNNSTNSYNDYGGYYLDGDYRPNNGIFGTITNDNNIKVNSGRVAYRYIMITFPYEINLKKYTLSFTNGNWIKEFYICGLNEPNNTDKSTSLNWYMLDYQKLISVPTTQTDFYINSKKKNSHLLLL